MCVFAVGDSAGPAQAAEHSSTVPATDVCSSAAASNASDSSAAAAAPQHSSAPEPGSRAAGGLTCQTMLFTKI